MLSREELLKLSVFSIFGLLILVSAGAKQTFGDPNSGSLPEIQNITVYNVTDLSEAERDDGGELLAYGLNTTYLINQTENQRDYRFTFEIQNTGPEYWNLSSEDDLFHDGLETSWSINRTWYNISGNQYEGGEFSNGKLSWDTGLGGNLSSDNRMYSNYIVEVDQSSSQNYSQEVFVNDTSNESGTRDYHTLDLNRLGDILVTLEEPPNETVLTQNKTFEINTTVECSNGECGDITATSRYNESSNADTLIPEDEGEPFHTLGSNSDNCANLLSGESCSVLFDVNATGSPDTYHLLDTNVSSSYSEIQGTNTRDAEVQINQVAAINLTWSTVDFDTLDPGDENKPANGNQNLTYNISIPESSNAVDIWVSGEDLESEENTNYRIGIGNMTYRLENDVVDSNPISNVYQLVKGSVSPGSVLNSFYWLDVPTGIIKGPYRGSITFKANLTG